MKTLLRKAEARSVDDTWRRIGALLDRFTPTECATTSKRRIRFNLRQPLIAAAAGADAAVTGASVGIAAQPVGSVGFERVGRWRIDCLMIGSMAVIRSVEKVLECVDCIGALAGAGRNRARQRYTKRQRQD
jgi:hypothetical protein